MQQIIHGNKEAYGLDEKDLFGLVWKVIHVLPKKDLKDAIDEYIPVLLQETGCSYSDGMILFILHSI